jgi:anti-sigma regulatory factor (Ser/Thr protein kinase)
MERRVTLASVPEAPSQARAVVDDELRPLARKIREDAALLVSELVANAVRHVPTNEHLQLELRTEPGRIRVAVSDPGGGFQPAPRLPTVAEGSGWGLYLVDRIADRWGVVSKERNEVWFEIDVHDDGDDLRST